MEVTRFTLLILIYLFGTLKTSGQVGPETMQQLISDDHKLARLGVRYPSAVRAFYDYFRNLPVWLDANGAAVRRSLFDMLQHADDLGLSEPDYRNPRLQVLNSNVLPPKNEDSLITDVLITDAAIHFFADVQNGNTAPMLRYNGISYAPDIANIPRDLAAGIRNGNLVSLTGKLEPLSPEYDAVKQRLGNFTRLMKEDQFKEITVTSAKQSTTNTPLFVRLYQLGLLQEPDTSISCDELTDAVKSAQRLFNLSIDGKLGKITLKALNVPIGRRREELVLALNTLRWLHQIRQTRQVILVNIPSASLLVYESGKIVLESKIIVGKSTTPTPTLSSKVTEVILYPFWMVPNRIATRELLPQIKKNVSYLDQNSFQVLSKQGKLLNPYSINWFSISTANFPFIIRQSTGCDNSLGIIKLNFYNPFTVYLHDTPAKQLFRLNRRYFSHGCMRVEKAIDLGRVVLSDNRMAVDTISEKGCLKSQAPIAVPVKDPVNVLVLYSTVWYDSSGRITFFEDIYERNNRTAVASAD